MIIEIIQNPHYIIDFNSYEGLRNISITGIVFVLILILGKNLNKSKNLFFIKIISLIALSQTGYDNINDIINNNWKLEEDLPLHLCSFSNLIVISMLFFKPNKKVFEFLFYCGFLGGFVSILTPQINYYDGGWFMYISYYVSHSIIMLVPLYMFYNLGYKLSKYSWLKTFGILNILMIFILPLNFLIGKGSNYMYLYEAPQIKNPLVFGDWPYYIINWEIIIIVLFYVTYLIFTRKKDIMKKSPIEIFSDWVDNGKDDGMEINHSSAVSVMLNKVLNITNDYSFIDAGCGNGWVVRKVSKNSNCLKAIGIDGSKKMIEKAKSLDTINNYYCNELSTWKPREKVEIVHSMEVLYYFKNPLIVIKNIYNNWLKENGKFIMGIDFYFENQPSHNWPEKTNVSIMTLLSIKQWEDLFVKAGFKNIEISRTGEKNDWKGTLIIMASKN